MPHAHLLNRIRPSPSFLRPCCPRLQDFKRVLAAPGRILAGFALQYTVMPLMAFAVSRLMGLPLAYAIG